MPFKPDTMERLGEVVPAIQKPRAKGKSTRRLNRDANGYLAPTPVTEDEANEILAAIEAGSSIRQALAPEHLPSADSWYKALSGDGNLAERYSRACMARADVLRETALDQVLGLARKDVTSNEINASRAILDGIKWVAAVTHPHKYAPKAAVEHSGSIDAGERDPRELAKAVLAALGSASLVGVKALEGGDE